MMIGSNGSVDFPIGLTMSVLQTLASDTLAHLHGRCVRQNNQCFLPRIRPVNVLSQSAFRARLAGSEANKAGYGNDNDETSSSDDQHKYHFCPNDGLIYSVAVVVNHGYK